MTSRARAFAARVRAALFHAPAVVVAGLVCGAVAGALDPSWVVFAVLCAACGAYGWASRDASARRELEDLRELAIDVVTSAPMSAPSRRVFVALIREHGK